MRTSAKNICNQFHTSIFVWKYFVYKTSKTFHNINFILMQNNLDTYVTAYHRQQKFSKLFSFNLIRYWHWLTFQTIADSVYFILFFFPNSVFYEP